MAWPVHSRRRKRNVKNYEAGIRGHSLEQADECLPKRPKNRSLLCCYLYGHRAAAAALLPFSHATAMPGVDQSRTPRDQSAARLPQHSPRAILPRFVVGRAPSKAPRWRPQRFAFRISVSAAPAVPPVFPARRRKTRTPEVRTVPNCFYFLVFLTDGIHIRLYLKSLLRSPFSVRNFRWPKTPLFGRLRNFRKFARRTIRSGGRFQNPFRPECTPSGYFRPPPGSVRQLDGPGCRPTRAEDPECR